METIQVQIPSDLARRLEPHYRELPQILEWGLRHIEAEQQQLTVALRQAGAIGPEQDQVIQYLEAEPWVPVQAGGQAASDIIIEERDSRPWSK